VSDVVIAPLLVALVTAVATLATGASDRLTRATSLLGGLAYLAAAAAVVATVDPTGAARTLVYRVSAWDAPVGIVLVADPLSAFVLGFGALVAVAALAFAVLYVDAFGQRLTFHPLFHFMLVGVTGSFLTGDIFNLFVWFEVMLMSSYVLVVFYSGPEHTRAALNYVVLNLIGSAVMLLAIGGIYATTGTLNMADLADRLANPAAHGVAVLPVLGLSAVLFAVFALKAGLVPFQFWVPAAYRAAPAPVTAVLAGVVKKVGVYAVIRLYFTVFAAASLPAIRLPGLSAFTPGAGASFLAFFGPVLFVMGAASILFGGLAAVGRDDLEAVLAYSSVAQVGFVVLPLAVAATVPAVRALGVAAALVYAFNHGLAKSLLFLVAGTVEDVLGTTDMREAGGLASRSPVLAAAFLTGALALVGVPPLSGFFGKFLVFDAVARAFAAGATGAGLALAVVLAGAVLTIAYYTRAWNAVFWGERSDLVEAALPIDGGRVEDRPAGAVADGGSADDAPGDDGDRDAPAADGGRADPTATPRRDRVALAGQVSVIAALAVAIVGFGIGFEAVVGAAEAGAEAALDTGTYVDAVAPLDEPLEDPTAGDGSHGEGAVAPADGDDASGSADAGAGDGADEGGASS
jgi:multicomponent Na+:H+ antiporter subunit D